MTTSTKWFNAYKLLIVLIFLAPPFFQAEFWEENAYSLRYLKTWRYFVHYRLLIAVCLPTVEYPLYWFKTCNYFNHWVKQTDYLDKKTYASQNELKEKITFLATTLNYWNKINIRKINCVKWRYLFAKKLSYKHHFIYFYSKQFAFLTFDFRCHINVFSKKKRNNLIIYWNINIIRLGILQCQHIKRPSETFAS